MNTSKPASSAARTSGCAMWTAPITIMRSGGFQTLMNSARPPISTGPARSARSAAWIAGSARRRARPAFARRLVQPLLARFEVGDDRRGPLRAPRREQAIEQRALHGALDEDPDVTSAREADFPGHLVGDAEPQSPRFPIRDRAARGLDHRALDATARHRAEELARVAHHELAAHGPRGEPQVDTTVASATPRPCAHHAAAWPSTSSAGSRPPWPSSARVQRARRRPSASSARPAVNSEGPPRLGEHVQGGRRG